VIRLEHIYKAYGRAVVVKDFSLTLDAGQVACLRGVNGSGKSTILQIIAGIAIADAGQRHVSAQRIALAGHAQQLLASLSIEQNLKYQAQVLGIAASALREAIDLFGVQAFLQKRPPELSQGMLQRVRLARAFAAKPDLLLLDEPQTGLDAAGRNALWRQTQACLQAGSAVVIASHEDLPNLGVDVCNVALDDK
jgi:ABC-type multidrug transport system ATPase subunit